MNFLKYFIGFFVICMLILVSIGFLSEGIFIPALILLGIAFIVYKLFFKSSKKNAGKESKSNNITNNETRCVVNFVNQNEWDNVELFFECWNENQVLKPKTSRKFTLIVGSNVQIHNLEEGYRRTHKVMGSSMYHEDYLIV